MFSPGKILKGMQLKKYLKCLPFLFAFVEWRCFFAKPRFILQAYRPSSVSWEGDARCPLLPRLLWAEASGGSRYLRATGVCHVLWGRSPGWVGRGEYVGWFSLVSLESKDWCYQNTCQILRRLEYTFFAASNFKGLKILALFLHWRRLNVIYYWFPMQWKLWKNYMNWIFVSLFFHLRLLLRFFSLSVGFQQPDYGVPAAVFFMFLVLGVHWTS